MEEDKAAANWAKTLRSMLDHESDAINQRIGWLGTFQGLLFTATGIAWNKNSKALCIVMCILGMSVAASVFTSLWAASRATYDLLDWWDHNRPADYVGPSVIGYRSHSRWYSIVAPWFALPFFFIGGWAAVLIINIRR